MTKEKVRVSRLAQKIGEGIRVKRKIMGLSQADLGNSIGITYQQVQKYENGQSNVNLEMLSKICNTLNVNVSEFLITLDNVVQDNEKEIQHQKLIGKMTDQFLKVNDPKIKKDIISLLETLAVNKPSDGSGD
jgi:transcriptional regulator with XRE-family HTH domain